MKRLIFVLAMSLCFLGCDKTPAAEGEHTHAEGADQDHAHDAACTCADGKKGGTIWCDTCGAGYIKEADIQLYFRRAKGAEVLMGDPRWHRKRVTRLLAQKPAPTGH